MEVKYKIIHVISSFEVFGPEKTTINECLWLINKGVECIIVNLHKVSDSPIRRKIDNHCIPYISLGFAKKLDIKTLISLRNVFKANQGCIVHSHGYKSDVLSLIASTGLDIGLSTTIHGWTSEDYKVRLYEGLQSFVWRYFDKVFSVSSSYLLIAKKKGVNPEKLSLLHNGIVPSKEKGGGAGVKKQYGIDAGVIVIGIVGRLSVEKNHMFFLDLVEAVLPSHTNVKFLIVGDGFQKGNIEREIIKREISKEIIMTGHVDDVGRIYDALDILVICSLREGLPNVMLEAMLNQVSVVSVDVGGVSEVISNDVSGFVVEENCTSLFLRKISLLIDDNEKRKDIGLCSRDRVIEKFTFESRMRRVSKYYRDIELQRQLGC